jgi:hypothetical protein
MHGVLRRWPVCPARLAPSQFSFLVCGLVRCCPTAAVHTRQAGRQEPAKHCFLLPGFLTYIVCVRACVRAQLACTARHLSSRWLRSIALYACHRDAGAPCVHASRFWCADPSSVLLAYCFSCCMRSHIRVHANAQECAGCGAVLRLGKLLALWGTDACGCACCEVLIQAWCCWCWGAASAFVVPCRCGSLPQSSKPPMLRQG